MVVSAIVSRQKDLIKLIGDSTFSAGMMAVCFYLSLCDGLATMRFTQWQLESGPEHLHLHFQPHFVIFNSLKQV